MSYKATKADSPYDVIECPSCDDDFVPDNFWDGEDTCAWCQAEVEWGFGGDTDGGYYPTDVQAVQEVVPCP